MLKIKKKSPQDTSIIIDGTEVGTYIVIEESTKEYVPQSVVQKLVKKLWKC